jgi:hypothetical protein
MKVDIALKGEHVDVILNELFQTHSK